MKNYSVEKFYQIVSNNPDLQNQLAAASNLDHFAKLAVELAQHQGYYITVQDVKTAISQKQSPVYDLSDEQLVAVAGGKSDGGGNDVSNNWNNNNTWHTLTAPAPEENSAWCQPNSVNCPLQNEPGNSYTNSGYTSSGITGPDSNR